MKNATSISVSVFNEIITPPYGDVNRFEVHFCKTLNSLTFPLYYDKLKVLQSVNDRTSFALFLRNFKYNDIYVYPRKESRCDYYQ